MYYGRAMQELLPRHGATEERKRKERGKKEERKRKSKT
jgi:hypothetical protein